MVKDRPGDRPAAVRVRDLGFAWPGGRALSYALTSSMWRAGKELLLLGPSGAGKSTLLSLICGIAPPSEGIIEVLGEDLAAMRGPARDRFRAEHYGVVFQMFNLLPYATAIDNVMLALSFAPRRRARAGADRPARAEAERLLTALGLDDAVATHGLAASLSVGQQQRVAVARALIGAPELVVAEEPGGGSAGVVDCRIDGACPQIQVTGDPPDDNPGVFRGHADPAIARDPAVPGRLWLAYSWPHVLAGRAPDGTTALMAAVSTHLARSDDAGVSFTFVGVPWPAVRAPDPERSGEEGVISSETPSIVAVDSGGVVTWYGAHLRYFLRPQTGYHPNYATSWHVRVGAAATPSELATAEEAVLGVSATAATYGADARLDVLAGLPLTRCAMLNNPALFASSGTLYLVVECLAFVGPSLDVASSTTQVFATTPAGPPPTWAWRHVGRLAGQELARELGADTVLQPELARAADGTPLFIVTPADEDPTLVVGTVGKGCVALELESLDPPALLRDCEGRAVSRARVTGTGIGACAHDPVSQAGIIATSKIGDGGWTLHASRLRP